MADRLKVFIYYKKAELKKEYFYDDFIYAINEVMNHNIEHEDDKWNIICDTIFPPKGLIWENKIGDWVENKIFFTKNIKFMDFF
jgi:hypothetical protein